MASESVLPTRLLRYNPNNREFSIVYPNSPGAAAVPYYDIISYTWGKKVPKYQCTMSDVTWRLAVPKKRLKAIKRLMEKDGIEYLWADCVCINQDDRAEKQVELPKMYQYYKGGRKCHILLEMEEVWKPQEIVDDLKFIDHILSHMVGTALATEARLTPKMINDLAEWANNKPWAFKMEKPGVKSAAIDAGVLNCYSTCINHVRSLFRNLYFSRVWTFQEMLLGKNITLWGVNRQRIECIGELDAWMDLATDARDKANKLQDWIDGCRVLNTSSVNMILRIIEDDKERLERLQIQVEGINAARTDIINGGPSWWCRNHKGVSNVFSAVSIIPRKCKDRNDIFGGLLGVFNGLFTPDEVRGLFVPTSDINAIAFAFFKQLSTKTGRAWTRLSISNGDRGEWDWIPVPPTAPARKVIPESNDVEGHGNEDDDVDAEWASDDGSDEDDDVMATDCLSGVVSLGLLRQDGADGLARAKATTGLIGVPREYMTITLTPTENRGFSFYFKGCNCGKKVKLGTFNSEPIKTYDQVRHVVGDETGGILVQCATILGSILDPGHETRDLVEYRERLLTKLRPYWDYTDPNARPRDWVKRCVSGTDWESPHPHHVRIHNESMHFRFTHMTGCGSRLENANTANISCTVLVNCGCKIIAPFSWIFEAITAAKGSPLGSTTASLDKDDRIILRDGQGLVQVGDLSSFSIVAFGGEVKAHRVHAKQCRSQKILEPVVPKLQWPKGRALVRDGFPHGGMMRDYGYVETGWGAEELDGPDESEEESRSCGNLLICRDHPMGKYKIIGVCIDGHIDNKKGSNTVTIR